MDARGAIAQLGERLHGMQEVVGSSPSGSTIFSSPCLDEGADVFVYGRKEPISKRIVLGWRRDVPVRREGVLR